MLKFILYVLLFAITFAFLYAWGYVKHQRKNQELLNNLYKKSKAKIIDELKSKGELTRYEIEEIVKGTKASLFWSKNAIQVTDPKLVTKNILEKMLNEGLVIEVLNNGPKKYRLK